MAMEAQHLIDISLAKITQARFSRGGVSLHKNLLVATVLQKAKFMFMEEISHMVHHYNQYRIKDDEHNLMEQNHLDKNLEDDYSEIDIMDNDIENLHDNNNNNNESGNLDKNSIPCQTAGVASDLDTHNKENHKLGNQLVNQKWRRNSLKRRKEITSDISSSFSDDDCDDDVIIKRNKSETNLSTIIAATTETIENISSGNNSSHVNNNNNNNSSSSNDVSSLSQTTANTTTRTVDIERITSLVSIFNFTTTNNNCSNSNTSNSNNVCSSQVTSSDRELNSNNNIPQHTYLAMTV